MTALTVVLEILFSINSQKTKHTASLEHELSSKFNLLLTFTFHQFLLCTFHFIINYQGSSLKDDWNLLGSQNESCSLNIPSFFTIVVMPSLASEFKVEQCLREKSSLSSLSFWSPPSTLAFYTSLIWSLLMLSKDCWRWNLQPFTYW